MEYYSINLGVYVCDSGLFFHLVMSGKSSIFVAYLGLLQIILLIMFLYVSPGGQLQTF